MKSMESRSACFLTRDTLGVGNRTCPPWGPACNWGLTQQTQNCGIPESLFALIQLPCSSPNGSPPGAGSRLSKAAPHYHQRVPHSLPGPPAPDTDGPEALLGTQTQIMPSPPLSHSILFSRSSLIKRMTGL